MRTIRAYRDMILSTVIGTPINYDSLVDIEVNDMTGGTFSVDVVKVDYDAEKNLLTIKANEV